MPRPLVSIVIPAFDAERWIAEAIESVVRQTMADFECIVVDDGSADDTAAVVATVRDRRVRCERQTHGGVSRARNHGLAVSRGDYVAFLDADDVWRPTKLERQLAWLSGCAAFGACVTDYLLTDERLVDRGRVRSTEASWLGWLLLEGMAYAFGSTAMVRRTAAIETGPFDEALSTSADLDYVCRLRTVTRIGIVSEPLVLYRQHASDVQMHRHFATLRRDMSTVLERHAPSAALRRRGQANLAVRAAFEAFRARRWSALVREGRVAATNRPFALASLPVAAAARRVRMRLAARLRRAARR